MVGRTLTSSDPEPPPGTLVRDDCGTLRLLAEGYGWKDGQQ